MIEFLPFISIIIVLGGQLIALAFWLGGITRKLNEYCNHVSHLAASMKEIVSRLDDINTRLSRLEGRFDKGS